MQDNFEKTHKQYYEEMASCRPPELTPLEQGRIQTICSLAPKDIRTVLDVGCGDGRFTNILAEKYDTTGIDISQFGLKSVRAKKLCGDSRYLPFYDNTFDLVVNSEILEHLPAHWILDTAKELERVSKKYILVSVPNKNCLLQSSVKCKRCKKIFNTWGHLTSFSLKELKEIFKKERLHSYLFYGPLYDYYNPILLLIKQKIANSWFECETAICPSCGNKFKSHANRNIISMGCNFANKILGKVLHRKTWLIALFEKQGI